ncbi:unnamed protein product, partial [Tetraodon nigroviridis]
RGIREELGNVSLLLFLYVLQGIPLGLAGSVPLILQSRNVSYSDQAFFSFVFWPFSLKLLWAPLVDSLYFRRFGRRKSWLVPSQYLLGLFMIFLSGTVDRLLEGGDGPQVVPLTAVFFMLAFLAATQVGYRGASPRARHACPPDLCALPLPSGHRRGRLGPDHAVQGERGLRLHLQLRGPDGRILPGQRALPGAGVGGLLQQVPQGGAPGRGHRHPVGYGAPGAGQRAPGGTALLTVVSAVLSAPDFLFFWGMVFLVSTTLVAILKRENAEGGGGRGVQEETQGVTETYKLLFSIIKLPSVFTFCVLLLTAKVGFSAADAVTGLKLVEAGVPKETLALLAVPLVPLQILLPLAISKYTAGPRPLDVFHKAFPFRLLMGLEFALLVWWTPSVRQQGGFPVYYYATILLSYALHQVALYSMYVACMAFHAKVSDPLIGGTYMTLLNTVTNLGGNWPSTVALWMVDPLTSKECRGAAGQSCSSAAAAELCAGAGGACVTTLDGYYVESVVCVAIGLLWWAWLGKKMKGLQGRSPEAWKCQ